MRPELANAEFQITFLILALPVAVAFLAYCIAHAAGRRVPAIAWVLPLVLLSCAGSYGMYDYVSEAQDMVERASPAMVQTTALANYGRFLSVSSLISVVLTALCSVAAAALGIAVSFSSRKESPAVWGESMALVFAPLLVGAAGATLSGFTFFFYYPPIMVAALGAVAVSVRAQAFRHTFSTRLLLPIFFAVIAVYGGLTVFQIEMVAGFRSLEVAHPDSRRAIFVDSSIRAFGEMLGRMLGDFIIGGVAAFVLLIGARRHDELAWRDTGVTVIVGFIVILGAAVVAFGSVALIADIFLEVLPQP